MPMTNDQFAALVERVEQMPARQYRTRLAMLAVLGYAFILGVVGIFVGFFFSTMVVDYGDLTPVVLPISVMGLLFAGSLLKPVAVRIPPPAGLELSRAQAPALFEMLDSVSASLQAPRFHHVLLDNSFNAGVVQVPLFGMLGWQINCLVLGLPLLQALSPDGFTAVVAHELGTSRATTAGSEAGSTASA